MAKAQAQTVESIVAEVRKQEPAQTQTLVEFEHNGAKLQCPVNAAGRVALRAIHPCPNGINPGEVFGELPAVALQLVMRGHAVTLNADVFSEELLASVRA